jgi:hypothetical protein
LILFIYTQCSEHLNKIRYKYINIILNFTHGSEHY